MADCIRVKVREEGKETVKSNLCGEELNRQVYDRVSPSVMEVDVKDRSGNDNMGTGFFVDSKQLVTNAHVVLSGDNVSILDKQNVLHQGRVLKVDEVKDLALVELVNTQGIEPHGKPLKLSTAIIEQGQSVWALGHSGSSTSLVLSPGKVVKQAERFADPRLAARLLASGADNEIKAAAKRYIDQPVVSSTANVKPGGSGGPATNSKGEVVYVTSLSLVGDAKGNNVYETGVDAAQVKEFLTDGKSDFKFDYQWQSKYQYRPFDTARDDIAIAGLSGVLPQMMLPLNGAYHAYNLYTKPNSDRKIADAAIISGTLLAISKRIRPLGYAVYGLGLAFDAYQDVFVKDNLVATKISRTQGNDRPHIGNVVLQKANELLAEDQLRK